MRASCAGVGLEGGTPEGRLRQGRRNWGAGNPERIRLRTQSCVFELCAKIDQIFKSRAEYVRCVACAITWRVFYSVFLIRRLVVPRTEHEL